MKYLFLSFLISGILQASVLEKDGDAFRLTKNTFKASELLADYSRLMNLNLSVDTNFLEESFEVNGKSKLTKDQVEAYVSKIMYLSENALIVIPGAPYISVTQARDARYTVLPVISDEKDIPENDNYIHFQFRLNHADPSDLARNMRPFLSRYGRVLDHIHARTVHILDTGNNVRRMVTISKILDVEEFKQSKKEIDDINEKHRKILKKEKSVVDILIENNGVFLIVFLLLGLIIGFGVRGYAMKRIEGGW